MTVNGTSGTPGLIRAGNGTSTTAAMTLALGLTVNANAEIGIQIFNGSVPSTGAAGSSGGSASSPSTNSFFNITGGTTTISSSAFVLVDLSTVTDLHPSSTYSFKVGQGAGTQSSPVIPSTDVLFNDPNSLAIPGSGLLSADGSGNLYLSFSTAVPEPFTVLPASLLMLALVHRLRRTAG